MHICGFLFWRENKCDRAILVYQHFPSPKQQHRGLNRITESGKAEMIACYALNAYPNQKPLWITCKNVLLFKQSRNSRIF